MVLVVPPVSVLGFVDQCAESKYLVAGWREFGPWSFARVQKASTRCRGRIYLFDAKSIPQLPTCATVLANLMREHGKRRKGR
jgi:hypothetical protein